MTLVFLTFNVGMLATQLWDTGLGQVCYSRNRFWAPKLVLPILSESAENSINPIAITPIFDGLDCPQNQHYSTTAHKRRSKKLLGHQTVDLVWHGYWVGEAGEFRKRPFI
jgi:hypothetical protein